MIPYAQSKKLTWRHFPIIVEILWHWLGCVARYYFYYVSFKSIGRGVMLARNVSFGGLYNIEIGDNVSINQGCNLYGDFGITIGNDTKLSPYVQIYSANYKYSKKSIIGSLGLVGSKVNIGKGVWIGSGSVIVPGIAIGDGSIIAALSVVTKDVPENEVWGGVPARFIKKID